MNKNNYIFFKPFLDVLLAFLVCAFILSWLTPILTLLIFIEAGENPFYTQTRIGQNGKPFKIYKFKSMKGKAPINDPLLSVDEAKRITKLGRFLRKYRIDELPQFFNVLKCEMSIVGPRPERQFFLNEISKKLPKYKRLLTLKPGITSLGQIKYGYADNLQQMLKRARYDLLYLDNVSLYTDIKVILNTILVVFQGKGK